MTYNWNSGFDEYPKGNDFGVSMGQALRGLKVAFEERFTVEHEFATLTSEAVMVHLAGKGSVIKMSDGVPLSLGVDGALQWDCDGKKLYRDGGVVMEAITTSDHGSFSDLLEDDHTQYLLQAGGEITAAITVPNIEGIPTSEGPEDTYALSRKRHFDAATAGGARHDNNIITSLPSDAKINGQTKIDWKSATPTINVVAGGVNVTLAGRSTMPRVTHTLATGRIYWLCSTQNVNDYVGRFRLLPNSTSAEGNWEFAYEYLE